MKNVSAILIVLATLLSVACGRTAGDKAGEKTLAITEIQIDSLVISGDSTSFRGHFEFMDTSLIFVDVLYNKLFPYSIFSGKPGKPFGGLGKGPNEMVGIMYGASISPSDTSMWILDSSNGVYEFVPESGKIEYLKRLDFSWDKLERDNYDSPSVYNIMEMSDFGVTITDVGNNEVLIPVSLISRHLNGKNINRYKKGHILGLLDKSSLKVKKVFGSLPTYYQEHPLPLFEFFDYAMDHNDSIIYVSHAPDSLIYCYRYPDSLLYTMGFEPQGLHRDFNFGYDPKFEDFRKEIRRASVNTGLYFDTIDNLLFRTSITELESGNSVMQVYKDKDLLAEVKVPPFFKMLGRVGDRYYAVRFRPIETEDEEVQFILYSFDKLPLDK